MKKIITWSFVLVLVLLLQEFLMHQPDFIDSFYIEKWYLFIDKILSNSFGWISFSVGDILYLLLGCYLFYCLIKILRSKNQIFLKLVTFSLKTSALFLWSFQLLWGFSNLQTPLHKKLEISLDYSEEELLSFTKTLISKIKMQHLEIQGNSSEKVIIKKDISHHFKAALQGYKNINLRFHLPVENLKNVKPSLFSKLLTKMGFSGYFNPFTHENQVNNNIPNTSLPITTAHEMSHQLGIAKESEANFLAYLTMSNQSEIKYRYTATLFALRYCLAELSYSNEKAFEQLHEQLPLGVLKNIDDAENFWKENKSPWASTFFKIIYGNFLKFNKQPQGMRTYNQLVDLMINYHKKFN